MGILYLNKYYKPIFEGIILMSFLLEGTNGVACLLLHGFAGQSEQMQPFAEYLHKQGFTCKATMLTGHGTDPKDLRDVPFHQWIEDAEKEFSSLKRLNKPIVLIGHSMGGAISLYLASKYPVETLILLATPTYMWPCSKPVISMMGIFSPILMAPRIDLLRPNQHHNIIEGYSGTPASSVIEFLNLLDFVRPHIPKVTAPTLFFQSYWDYVVPFTNATAIKNLLGSSIKKICYLTKTLHLPHLDQERETVFEKSAQFITANISETIYI